jgi:hypothetical protein
MYNYPFIPPAFQNKKEPVDKLLDSTINPMLK